MVVMRQIYSPGHVLAVDLGAYRHVGISDGQGGVFENSARRGRPSRVTLEEFSGGKRVEDRGIPRGSAPPWRILERAEAIVSSGVTYRLSTNNCEHFVTEALGVGRSSHQIQRASVALSAFTVAARTSNPAVKGGALVVGGASLLTEDPDNLIRNCLIAAGLFAITLAVLRSG